MTRHDDAMRLRHMLDYATEAAELARDRRREDLESDRLLRYAMTHLVEVVGEAAAHVSQAFREDHPTMPWAEIVGMRNRLIHGYDKVDLDVLWQIIQADLPSLVVDLRNALGEGA